MAPPRKKRRLSGATAEKTEATSPGQRDVKSGSKAIGSEQPDAISKAKRTLFVRSLPATTTTESLAALFSESYPIKHATAVIDSSTKLCKGYGFVTFADAEDASTALQELKGTLLEGKHLNIEFAQPRQRQSNENSATQVENGTAKPTQKPAAQLSSKLIVRNLPWSFKDPKQLEKLFQSYGKIKDVTLPKKPKSSLMAGFGFVTLRGHNNAQKAIEGLNGKTVDGRPLAVDWAVKKDLWQNTQQQQQEDLDQKHDSAIDDQGTEELDDEEELAGNVLDNDDLGERSDDSFESDSDVDMKDGMHDAEDTEATSHKSQLNDTMATIFVRNLPFTCQDDDLYGHFSSFGRIRYARVVMEQSTGRSRGTGFVRFVADSDAIECLKNAPYQSAKREGKVQSQNAQASAKDASILQEEDYDPTGEYTMNGRVLQVTKALDRTDAQKIQQDRAKNPHGRQRDKRRTFLLSEGSIPSTSPLYQQLSTTEVKMRVDSYNQRKRLLQGNPSLMLSLTRLSIRNIPHSVTSKDLKDLGREALVGFASDVQEGTRQKLSKEELGRDHDSADEADKRRRLRGKGVVKQAKVVFENKTGNKVSEESGAGRSRGYGFLEFFTHRAALMALRWLNGHAVREGTMEGAVGTGRSRRLIVEFAIENAQVVKRRSDRELKSREGGVATNRYAPLPPRSGGASQKRHAGAEVDALPATQPAPRSNQSDAGVKDDAKAKLAGRNSIIARKRLARKTRKRAG